MCIIVRLKLGACNLWDAIVSAGASLDLTSPSQGHLGGYRATISVVSKNVLRDAAPVPCSTTLGLISKTGSMQCSRDVQAGIIGEGNVTLCGKELVEPSLNQRDETAHLVSPPQGDSGSTPEPFYSSPCVNAGVSKNGELDE